MLELAEKVLVMKRECDVSLMKVTSYIKDKKRASLEDRWETYLLIEKLLPLDPWKVDLFVEGATKITYHDELKIARYGQIRHSEMINLIVSAGIWDFDQLDVLRERFLQTGYGGCINNWDSYD